MRYDIDTFKGQQVQVTEKISEMIKMEVDSRLQTDKESKSLYQGLIRNAMNEIQQFKEQQELTLQRLVKDVKETAQDSAERAHFLSRYIDEEVLKIG
jgi:gas vesicle protein